MVSYEDVASAADWLRTAFGFQERLRYTESDGTISHVQLELGEGLIMLGSAGGDYVSPKRHAQMCEVMRSMTDNQYVSDGVHVYVDDVTQHYETARSAGARILTELEETPFGDRHYRAEDLEGHRWMFAQHIRDVKPEDWGAST
jgi:uncharacterized glyoxalase superfamily protein PhnB